MDAIILAGGKGTRLAGVVADVPKPLALVGGRPFLDHLVDFLKASGAIERIIISAGYKADRFEKWARAAQGIKINVVAEKEPLGTGGALLHVCDTITADRVLVLNGDSLIRVDIPAMTKTHKKSGCAVTMVVTQVADVSLSGEVVMSGDRITDFHEKGGGKRPGWINAGIYLIDKTALESFSGGACSLEHQMMPHFVKIGLHAFPAEGAFVDIGTPENYAKAAGILGVV